MNKLQYISYIFKCIVQTLTYGVYVHRYSYLSIDEIQVRKQLFHIIK
jgi:hypothetical protein